MNILDKIILTKKDEVKVMKREKISFVDKLKNNKFLSIIAEVKRASPSKGDLNVNLNVESLVKSYEKNGATAISVLTDRKYFKGSFEDLYIARENTSLPLLCKDFIVDKTQIDYAQMTGADIILLIVAALDDNKIKELYTYARSQNLDVIVETHNEEEIERALKINPRVIGINNRNLKTFETNIETTLSLANKVKEKGIILISESGIKTKEDIEKLAKAGVDAILIGESFVTSSDVDKTVSSFKVERIKQC